MAFPDAWQGGENCRWKGHCRNSNRENQGCTTEGMKQTLETGEGGEGKQGMVTPCSPNLSTDSFLQWLLHKATSAHSRIFWRPKLLQIQKAIRQISNLLWDKNRICHLGLALHPMGAFGILVGHGTAWQGSGWNLLLLQDVVQGQTEPQVQVL